jgi:hypothetical protein
VESTLCWSSSRWPVSKRNHHTCHQRPPSISVSLSPSQPRVSPFVVASGRWLTALPHCIHRDLCLPYGALRL